MILESPCEEALGKEKSRKPKDGGNAILNPRMEKSKSIQEFIDPRSQGFQGRVGFLFPCWWNLRSSLEQQFFVFLPFD